MRLALITISGIGLTFVFLIMLIYLFADFSTHKIYETLHQHVIDNQAVAQQRKEAHSREQTQQRLLAKEKQ